ncbi:hypothetical protein HOM98_00065 [Candidatus Peregrinibacteria bacterium]|jgi:hypothetical protein|nr:hypothetical protein [Candidatus Peregrinibacteria bacterium]MBT7483980.1 hypothetical protein [Candidatus Peregrinibacteria bacterium]
MDGETPGFTPPQDSTPQTPPPTSAAPTPPSNQPTSGKSPLGSRNTIIAIVLVVLIAVGGFAYWNQKQNEKELEELLQFLDDFGDDFDYDDYDYDYDDYDYDYEDDYTYGDRDSYLLEESGTTGFSHFSDLEYFFETDYPTAWEVDVDDSIVAATFLSPYEDALDYFSENVNITTEDVSWYGDLTLDEYRDSSLGQIELALPGYEVVDTGDTYLGSDEAQYILGKYAMGDFDTRILSTFALDDYGTAYVVTYTYEADKVDLYQTEIDHMLRTFEIW